MNYEIVDRLKLDLDREEADILLEFLDRVKVSKRKSGFVNIVYLEQYEMELLNVIKDIVNVYFGKVDPERIGKVHNGKNENPQG